MAVNWIKLHTKTFDNALLKSMIVDGYESSRMALIWVQLLLLAGKQNQKGKISISEDTPYSMRQLAAELVLIGPNDEELLRKTLKIFSKNEMISCKNGFIDITNWESYQNADRLDKIRASDVERYHRKKDKKMQIPAGNSTETPAENALNIDLDLDLEKEKQKTPHYIAPVTIMKPVEVKKAPVKIGWEGWFEIFWKEYPKKENYIEVKAWFQQAKDLDELGPIIIKAVKDQSRSIQWTKEGTRYVPSSLKWLNNAKWHDELERNPAFPTPEEEAFADLMREVENNHEKFVVRDPALTIDRSKLPDVPEEDPFDFDAVANSKRIDPRPTSRG